MAVNSTVLFSHRVRPFLKKLLLAELKKNYLLEEFIGANNVLKNKPLSVKIQNVSMLQDKKGSGYYFL